MSTPADAEPAVSADADDTGVRHVRPDNERREVNRWAMYAFANHGWVTTVGTVLIGPWLLALATSAAGSDRATLIALGPFHLSAAAFPSAVITFASILQVVCLPVFGAAADTHGRKKLLLYWTCGIGAALTVGLGATHDDTWLLGGLIFLVGSVVFGATDVVYNSLLPFLVPTSRRDAASGRGFAIGYLGAGSLLVLNLALLQFHDVFGIDRSAAVRLCFVMAGIWWGAIGLWAIAGLREPVLRVRGGAAEAGSGSGGAGGGGSGSGGAAGGSGVPSSRLGMRQLWHALRDLARMPNTFRFLVGFLLFTDGISAVTGLASTYITHELYGGDADAAATFLFALILLIQFLAVGGSALCSFVARRFGTKPTLIGTLVLWCGVVIYAYAALHSTSEAAALGAVIGLVIGGAQALARSLYSQMIPHGSETTFFSLYAIVDKGTSWIAPLLFTLVVNETGSFRQAILSLIVMFVAGMAFVISSNIDKAREEAAQAP